MCCEVLHLSPGEAAQRLQISKEAIRRYRSTATQKLEARGRRDAVTVFINHYPEDVATLRDIPVQAMAESVYPAPTSVSVEGSSMELNDAALDDERQIAGRVDRTSLRVLIEGVLSGIRPDNLSGGLVGLLIVGSAVAAGMVYFAVTGIASLLAAAASTLGVPLH